MTLRFRENFRDVLNRHRGIAPGFDVMRVCLALTIFVLHARWLSGVGTDGPFAPLNPNLRPFAICLLPMFFALSGFLVMGSAVRVRATSTFLAFRALRIFPALGVEVVLSAFLLGAIYTTLPLATYFTSSHFFRYFGNIFGFITYELPGVFMDNRIPGIVNLNLWTLPAEFDCYAITAILIYTGILFRRDLITYGIVAVTIFCVGLNAFTDFAVMPRALAGYTLTYYFFVGMLFFQWLEHIPRSWLLFIGAGVLSYVFLYFNHTIYIAPVFLTYCTIFLGMLAIPKIKFISSGDYSYGIYLYGFPILQALMVSFPSLHGHALASTAAGGTLTILFAVCSWHAIEKRALAFKKKLPVRFFPLAPKAIVPMPDQRARGDGADSID